MAEISLDQDHVYDATQSTLLTLKELSAIAVALKIWHGQINKYRTIDELEIFIPRIRPPFLMVKNPDLPTVIDAMIRNYASKLGPSIDKWLREHHKRVLFFHYSHQNYILEDFDDFVCDYDGTIDYAKTAERMMRCDKFGDVEKFKIACTYFFEDDIRRLWPSIRKKIGLDCINFGDCPELYYWICYLTNELNKIPINRNAGNNTVDEEMLASCMPYNRTAVEYFWNRVPHQNKVRKAVRLQRREMVTFIKFVLPKFDDQQLDEYVNNEYCDLMHTLLKYHCLNERLICQTWMRIRNFINERNFAKLVVAMFEFYNDELRAMDENQYSENWLYLCREIWLSASHGLRRSAIDEISSKFWSINVINRDCSSDLLMTLLTCVTFEERSLFWSKCWPNLIACKNNVQLQQIMEICFENGDAINLYKENVMATSEHVQHVCSCLLYDEPDFDKLSDLVDFFCLNKDTARLFKQKLLESNFLCEDPVLLETYFGHAIKFNKFINDAYNNIALAINFKSNLMSIPMIRCFTPEYRGSMSSWSEQLVEFMAFIETFISTEGELKSVKMLVIDHWKKTGVVVETAFNLGFTHEWSVSVDQFLLWCLGSDEEVEKFKQTDLPRFLLESDAASGKYIRKNILDSIINDQWSAYHDQVFLWCLGGEEEVGKFKQTCARHFYNLGLLN